MSRRKPSPFQSILKQIFGPVRKTRPSTTRLAAEELDSRIVPTLTLTVSTSLDNLTGSVSGNSGSGSLRFCIGAANASSDNDVRIQLTAGTTYDLSIKNTNNLQE